MRVGILGGSFNPPHLGHLALARTALESGLVDRVCLIPAATPPHKVVSGHVDAAKRSAMAHLLAGEDDRLSVDDIELRRSGPSYTIDTLHELRAANPGVSYRIIIGSDLAKTFATWRSYREILEIAPPLVAERPDDVFHGDADYAGMTPDEIQVMKKGRFEMEPVDISSTMIRRLVSEGAPDASLLLFLTGPVLSYVRDNRLYL